MSPDPTALGTSCTSRTRLDRAGTVAAAKFNVRVLCRHIRTSTAAARQRQHRPPPVRRTSASDDKRKCPGRLPLAGPARPPGRLEPAPVFVVVIPSDCSRGLWVVLRYGKEDAKAQRHSGAGRPGHPPAGPRRQARRRNHRAGRGFHGRLSERGRRAREGPSPSATVAALRALSPVWKTKAERTTDTLSLLAQRNRTIPRGHPRRRRCTRSGRRG